MKKSTIKRRKRVVPAQPDTPLHQDYSKSSDPSVSPVNHQFTTVNDRVDQGDIGQADGSVGHGGRMTPGGSTYAVSRSNESSPHRSENGYRHLPVDFTQYPSRTRNSRSLHDSNGVTVGRPNNSPVSQRQPSVSPHLSHPPSRKRSFSTTEDEGLDGKSISDRAQLSSIPSILNPSQCASGDIPIEPSLLAMDKEDSRARNEKTSTEKRAELQRQADALREMLAAKERELAGLNADS